MPLRQAGFRGRASLEATSRPIAASRSDVAEHHWPRGPAPTLKTIFYRPPEVSRGSSKLCAGHRGATVLTIVNRSLVACVEGRRPQGRTVRSALPVLGLPTEPSGAPGVGGTHGDGEPALHSAPQVCQGHARSIGIPRPVLTGSCRRPDHWYRHSLHGSLCSRQDARLLPVTTIWVPFADVTERLGQLPGALVADYWAGGQLPKSVAEVELFVVPFLKGNAALAPLKDMASLRVIQTLAAGYEDLLPHVPEGVTLCNALGVQDASTAELAVTLMLSSLRGIPDFVRAAERGAWAHAPRPSLADRTVIIVGYGGVGRAVERRLAGFETHVVRVASTGRLSPEGEVHGMADLPELLPSADVVALCLPLNDRTRGLVDAAFLRRLKDGALIVNVGRGAVVDTAALVDELHRGRLTAALDVTEPEPLPPNHPLWSLPGALVSPHVGGTTSAFQPRADRFLIEQLRRFASGEQLLGVVAVGPATDSSP